MPPKLDTDISYFTCLKLWTPCTLSTSNRTCNTNIPGGEAGLLEEEEENELSLESLEDPLESLEPLDRDDLERDLAERMAAATALAAFCTLAGTPGLTLYIKNKNCYPFALKLQFGTGL